jgi:hypothetical protein
MENFWRELVPMYMSFKKLPSGTNEMITVFGDFDQFLAKQW